MPPLESPEGAPRVARALGRLDLVLLTIVAIVNINNVPPTATLGKSAILLWSLAFTVFFVPEAAAVLALSRRHPGEGGIYLWTRREFGDGHAFLAGWCYWTNNLLYVPVMLLYMAGVAAFAGGERAAHLAESSLFAGGVAFAWLALIAALNIRGLGVGKWVQNAGGISSAAAAALVLAAGAAAWMRGSVQRPPFFARGGWETAASFSVMCNAFIGAELASAMGDEIRDPVKDLKPAIFAAGAVSLASYALACWAVLTLVPIGGISAIQGIMQALSAGAEASGAGWLTAPLAAVMALSIGGAASAWFSGSARIPFVAGLDGALPAALGRVHPKWRTPHIALGACAALAAAFTAASLAGSSVAEAYQVLLKASVVLQLIPFIYLFLALARLNGASAPERFAGAVGLAASAAGIFLAFVPPSEAGSAAVFEAKMALGVAAPLAAGGYLYRRARARDFSKAAKKRSSSG